MKVSLCVHSWNEADALERLVFSSLPASDLIREWVVLDHRSTDHTQTTLDMLEDELAEDDIPLKRLYEARDLSRDFTFADLRNLPLDAASSDIVMILDADFILGSDFGAVLERGLVELTRESSAYYGLAFRVPVIWDHLTVHDHEVVDHGRVWWHSVRARLLHWPSVRYVQRGKHEKLKPPKIGRRQRLDVPNDGSVLVSVNVKPPERIELRRTMTMFMQDAMDGAVKESWLQAVAGGWERTMPAYAFDETADLRGVRLNAPEVPP